MRIKKQKPMERGAGILLPVSSLPSPYGIGAFGQAAYEFVDFLKSAGQKYWQVLPLGPTSYGDSPYQSFSAFAGNPYFIDLDLLRQQGLLTQEEIEEPFWGRDEGQVDYQSLYKARFKVLMTAFSRSRHQQTKEFKQFYEENKFWLEQYSLYMAVKTYFGGKEWLLWPQDIRLRQPKALKGYQLKLQKEAQFWQYCQFEFFRQWDRLKAYANENGIEIIGDIPIYVALDSADVWEHGELFQLDKEKQPTRVAGVPPDLFSCTGQLWGNPLYDWDRMKKEDFWWWKQRMSFSCRLYDVIRIDHFVGIAHYYSIPAGDSTAEHGVWITGPGEELIAAISQVMGKKRVIAEDLGIVIPQVRKIQKKSGYPGMKVLEFAFDGDSSNENLPCHYEKNCVVYGGTHDNETLAGFFPRQKRKIQQFARQYLGVNQNSQLPAAVIRAGYASAANTAIFQMQDFLELDNTARMNTPSTLGGNWRWRLLKEQLTPELAQKIKQLTILYAR